MERDRLFELTVSRETFCMAPFRAIVSLKRPLFRCWPGFTRSDEVACFVFQPDRRSSETFTSVASSINTVLLERHQEQLTAQVKFTVLGRCQERMKVLIDLDTFLTDLSSIGLVQVGRELILRQLQPCDNDKLHMEEEEQDYKEEEESRQQAPSLDINNLPYTITNNVQVSYHAPFEDSFRHHLSSSVHTDAAGSTDTKKKKKKSRKKRKCKESSYDPSWIV